VEDWIPYGSAEYGWLLATLVFARGMDLLSTWIATPNLALEGNPIAKRLGWKWGGLLNAVICVWFAAWPMVAIILSTTSLLVAAKNFSVAWHMRSAGEEDYRAWYFRQLSRTPLSLYLFCLGGQTALTALVGAALFFFSTELIPVAIGFGIIAYAAAVLCFTLLSIWRWRTLMRV
jgi:hypothetical protein